jgi:hopene-associated glycosyltransferase HpnB
MALGLCILMTASWLGLMFLWHGFWKVDQRLPLRPAPLKHYPKIAIIVPARNEAETITTTASALLAQNYSGAWNLTIANDSSTDNTADILAGLNDARLTTINTAPLPDGWAGKMWALDQGILQAAKQMPDYYWLTDADIIHKPDVLACLVAHAETNRLALVSQMVALRCQTFWEKLLVPAFIFYFSLIYPFRAINNPASAIAGAAGGSILIRRDGLDDIGGIAALKDAIIDDCTLGRLIKHSGRNIWLGFGEASTSLRGYDNLSQFWHMVQRSAYTQLRFSPLLLVAAIAGIAFSHLLPVYLFCWPALLVMAAIYWPTVRFYGLSPLWSLTLPFAAVLFGAMTLTSAAVHHLGWSNKWRGREIGKI